MTPEAKSHALKAIGALAEKYTDYGAAEYRAAHNHLLYVTQQSELFRQAGRNEKSQRWIHFAIGALRAWNFVFPTFSMSSTSPDPDFIEAIIMAGTLMQGQPKRMDPTVKLPMIPLTDPMRQALITASTKLQEARGDISFMSHLGHIQGYMWAIGWASIDDLKAMNRPRTADEKAA